jgi:hypothetical protein
VGWNRWLIWRLDGATREREVSLDGKVGERDMDIRGSKVVAYVD